MIRESSTRMEERRDLRRVYMRGAVERNRGNNHKRSIPLPTFTKGPCQEGILWGNTRVG